MPFENFTQLGSNSGYLIWRLDSEEQLSETDIRQLTTGVYAKLTHPKRRQELLFTRLALRKLLGIFDKEYTVVYKDSQGRPYLACSHDYISLSHCAPFCVAAIDEKRAIGIDVQWPTTKLLAIKGKFLNDRELIESGDEILKLCVYWSAKEAIYKAMGGNIRSLKEDVHISQFNYSKKGIVYGQVGGRTIQVNYKSYEGSILAWCRVC